LSLLPVSGQFGQVSLVAVEGIEPPTRGL
jgi:hypothetical protein